MAKIADNKTKQTSASVADFIKSIDDEQKRKDTLVILKLMEKITKEKPKMWGTALIGFGYVIITSPSGRTVEWFKVGFSPRKNNLSIYLSGKLFTPANLKRLGKNKTGMGCLYINKLEDVDIKVLEEMIVVTVKGQ